MQDKRNCNHATCEGPCRRLKQKKLRKPIRKVSRKRQRENKKYSTLRKQFLSDNPECVAELEGCTGVATEVHHSVGRVGENLLNVGTWKSVCRNCHRTIEDNPGTAKDLGLSYSRLKKQF
jgi:hypothetical protein